MLPSERLRLTAAARGAGYPDVSSWCRGTLLAACDGERLPCLDEAALAEVARMRRDLNSGAGSNLNQALAHANKLVKGGQSPYARALLTAVEGAHAALDAVRADIGKLLGPHGRVIGGEFRERRAGGRPGKKAAEGEP